MSDQNHSCPLVPLFHLETQAHASQWLHMLSSACQLKAPMTQCLLFLSDSWNPLLDVGLLKFSPSHSIFGHYQTALKRTYSTFSVVDPCTFWTTSATFSYPDMRFLIFDRNVDHLSFYTYICIKALASLSVRFSVSVHIYAPYEMTGRTHWS